MIPPCAKDFKMADVRATFVSQKISKIRWKPLPKQSLIDADTFATGSWDDEQNKVSLFKVEKQSPDGAGIDEAGIVDNDPVMICDAPHVGDVTGLEFVGQEYLVSSSSSGTVTLYRHHTNSQTLGIVHQWEKIHRHAPDRPSPCTCLATRGDEVIVTAGEDGRINILHIGHKSPNQVIDKADSSTVNSIIFLKQTEFITVNSTGQLKIYDMRVNSNEPAQTLSVTGDLNPLQCIDKHPGQPHIVATGGQDGVLGIWDLRQDRFPISLLEAHSSTMWEVKFHKLNPDHLFTCSEDGFVWHWDGSNINSVNIPTGIPPLAGTGAGSGGGLSTASRFQFGGSGVSHSSPWLATEVAKSKLEINSLLTERSLPVNSLDIEGHSLICGTDGETIFSINLPMLR